ncbi:unnamed protein product [Caenorhabditis nigoni]
MPSIIEMPELVLEKIIEVSDFKAVLTLRQVCRDFRNFIDDLNDSKLPDSKFRQINLYSESIDNTIKLSILNSEGSFYRFAYSELENSRRFQGKTTFLENLDIVDVAIRDLELILKFQKSILERIYFYLNDSQLSNDSSVHKFPVKLSNMFEKIGRRFKTNHLSIETYNQYQFMSILPFVDPDALKELNLITPNDREIEVNEIVKTEQWKQAEDFDCESLLVNLSVEDICHFISCSLKTNSITASDLDFLRKAYISSSKFEFSFFNLRSFNENEEISNLWGPAFISETARYWFFRMKDLEDKILRIEIYEDSDIQFDITEMTHVPYGAIVQDYNED